VLVAEARWRLGLGRGVIVPTGDPYHKEHDPAADGPTRVALAEAAFAGDEAVSVSPIEVEREGPSWTCETLEEIITDLPDSQPHFLMGADAALRLESWHRPERVLELARVGVAPRDEIERFELESVFDRLGAADRIDLFEMPRIDVSSSLIRSRVAAGEPFRHLVPAAVAEMIDNEGLYGN